MYYETPIKLMRVWTNSMALRSLPTDLATTKRSPVDMERVSENFRRLSAKRMRGRTVRRPVEAGLRKLFGTALILAIGMVFVPADATAKSPITCGTAYTVVRGDTLFMIAKRAFGNGKLYKQIFQANREILPNSASVEIGTEILIPCLDSTGKAVREDVVAQEPLAEPGNPEVAKAASVEPAQASSGLLRQAAQLVAMATMPMQSIAGPVNPIASLASITNGEVDATVPVTSEPQLDIPRIRLLTGSGFLPYADEHLPRGGMITDLVSRALNAAAPGQQSRVTFVNDWASHLNYLLPEGALDVSFPWYKPDCSKADKLSAKMQKRCAEFEFSNPIFEVRVGYYTQAGNPLVETGTLAALSGKRLCRPNGHFTFDLEQIGLVELNVLIETQYTAKECFARLVKGQVDVVTLVKSEGDEQVRQLGIAKAISEVSELESVQTLHALVSKQNPNGLAHLEFINRGLTELMASGKWFEVVSYHQGQQLALID
jgi:ABC-type amino acid transport substrate-binding protein